MATVAITLPRVRRTVRNQPVAAGRASHPEIYFVKRIDNSCLRLEVDTRNGRQCFCLLGLGILAFLGVFLFAHQHFQCLRYGYQVEQLKADTASLEEWNHRLRLEQARLADPQRIDVLAREWLGLAPPTPQQVVHVEASGTEESVPTSSELARNLSAAGNVPNGR